MDSWHNKSRIKHLHRQQNLNWNHVCAKMYENMKYKEFYFFTIYNSTIVYFDISKNAKCYPTTGSVYSTREKKKRTVETVKIQQKPIASIANCVVLRQREAHSPCRQLCLGC